MSGAYTPGPWGWLVHDHSLASLGVLPDPGLGDPLVMAVGPCKSCTSCVKDGEWKWGRCQTPKEADANLIAAAPDLYAKLAEVRSWMDPDVSGWDAKFCAEIDATLAKARGEA